MSSEQSRFRCVLGGTICFGLSAAGFYAALSPGRIEGGISLIPNSWNQHLGQFVFILGACITIFMGLYAFYQAVAPRRKE